MNINLKITPYPYQQEGIAYGLEHKRVLIGDECGLGKTLQSIGIINSAPAFPCLVICPSALKINWQREWEKFTDRKALVLDDSTRTTWPYLLQMGLYHVAIVNYESLRKYFVWDIKKHKDGFTLKDVVFCPHIKLFKAVIIDESHRCKDSTTAQSIFTKGLAQGKEWVLMLTGTPVVNNPNELLPQLSIMNRLEDFGGKGGFLRNYGHKDSLPALSAALYKRCLIRREKAKVLTQLPDKTRVDVLVDISNMDEYNLAWEDLAQYLREYKQASNWEVQKKMRMEALVRFLNLRAIAARGKVQSAADFIRLILENGAKVIVFCSYHTIVDALKEAFPTAVAVTGRQSALEKQAAVDAFQNDPACQLIICSIKAAGVGITLTASSRVIFVELPYTYADCVQAEDRAFRIGQKDNVTCYYLLGRHTIDKKLYKLIQDKRSIANTIMASADEVPTDVRYFEEIVNELI